MTAPNIIPFPFSSATGHANRTCHSAGGTGVSEAHADAKPIPGNMEALAACHADDLRRGSALDALIDVFDAAKDTRNNRPHVPEGVIATAVVELLAPVLIEMNEIIARLAARGALAEAQELDRELSNMPLDEALALWRELTPAQRVAVIWVQQQAMKSEGGVE